MKKPVMKKEIGILSASSGTRYIVFSATNDALADVQESFLYIERYLDSNQLVGRVDPRYDFDQVLAYMKGGRSRYAQSMLRRIVDVSWTTHLDFLRRDFIFFA